MSSIKIIAISDTHGYLPEIKEDFDLLLICGDVCPAHDHYYAYQINWIKNDFVTWINTLHFRTNFSKVVMVGGNHDFVFERITDTEKREIQALTNHRLMILKNENIEIACGDEYEYRSLKIFGTSYCKIFGNWAFMVSNEKLAQKYSMCDDDVDIIISHDAPQMNKLGYIKCGRWADTDAGNPELDKLINSKKPKVYLCGHIHSGTHEFTKIGDTYMANVAYVSEDYEPNYTPLIFEYDLESRMVLEN